MLTTSQQHLTDVLRWYGLGLQIAGLFTAAFGISQVRREWTQLPGVVGTIALRLAAAWDWIEWHAGRISHWVKRWVLRRHPPPIFRGAHDSAPATDSMLSIEPHFPLPARTADLAVKVDWLINRVWTLLDTTFRLDQELAAERAARVAADSSTTTALDQTERSVLGKIANLAGGGLRLQAWGVTSLALGIVLATVPDKLAGL